MVFMERFGRRVADALSGDLNYWNSIRQGRFCPCETRVPASQSGVREVSDKGK